MRFFERLFVKIFSLIILILSIFVILIGFNILDYGIFASIIKVLFADDLRKKITLVVCAVFILVSLKEVISRSNKPKEGKDGIILENGNGKLIISKESIDNMIHNAAKDIPGAESISSKTYLDLEQNLRVFVTLNISSNIAIKEISTQLQSKIKSTIKQTADIDVAEVNIKIKNIVNRKSKKDKNIQNPVQSPEEIVVENVTESISDNVSQENEENINVEE